jgi:hypothetical protein
MLFALYSNLKFPLITVLGCCCQHRQGAILRLRPIMMTALVAALGLLPGGRLSYT